MRGSSSREGQNRGPFCPARSRGGGTTFLFLPRRARQRPGPGGVTPAAFSGCFRPPRAAKRAPKRGRANGAICAGLLAARPHVAGRGLEGVFVAPFWRPLQGARAAACNSAQPVLVFSTGSPVSHFPFSIMMLYSAALFTGLVATGCYSFDYCTGSWRAF